MDIYMSGIAYAATEDDVILELADILHSEDYIHHSAGSILLNFQILLFPRKGSPLQHTGTGILTLPTLDVANQFLDEYGDGDPYTESQVWVCDRRIFFEESSKPARMDRVEYCRHMPYQDPRFKEEKRQKLERLDEIININSIQFGWMCKDGTFSVEWSKVYETCHLKFEDDDRRIRITGWTGSRDRSGAEHCVLRYANIKKTNVSSYPLDCSVLFSLETTPVFEEDLTGMASTRAMFDNPKNPKKRQRVSHLGDDDHVRVVPFVSQHMRVVLSSRADIQRYQELAGVAKQRFIVGRINVDQRALFSEEMLDTLGEWLESLPWTVAFHLEGLHKKPCLNTEELLALRPEIDRIWKAKGETYTRDLIRHFATAIKSPREDDSWDAVITSYTPALTAFRSLAKDFDPAVMTWNVDNTDGLFDCYHIVVTPTSVVPQEQCPDRSNRVIRSFPGQEQYFIRVQFCDEDYMRMRFPDREVDGNAFIRTRIGGTLRDGIIIAGREFEFLAYSQSALKEHTVWFVQGFFYDDVPYDAEAIRGTLGSFEKVIHYPALYGARMSQAFTATDPSVIVEAEEILIIPDVVRMDVNGREWQFTDGVGTISPELADEILASLGKTKKRQNGKRYKPRAFQIRFGGSKGVVSVDQRCRNRVMCLRPSMVKFEAPDSGSLEIEVARVFDKPGSFLLNRPLVMLLEGLGVPADVFMKLQDAAVRQANSAKESLGRASKLLNVHGLGAPFRLPQVFNGLQRLGLDFDHSNPDFSLDDEFPHRIVAYGINHVLRELKHHARIPVPESWTLVGIADIHNVLEEGQVFACVQPHHSNKRIYLQGAVLITRSPVIHPGDVQVLTAIGRPPPGSIYDIEPIANTIIFSVKGSRPCASCLGGGDLDGDTFNVSQYGQIFPSTVHNPASYEPAERKKLDRPSTIDDVIDFVVDFIISDNLGIISINWLIIADQSVKGIFDEACLVLGQLHSNAVDFQKSGKPVPNRDIPRLIFRAKPDWNAPETVNPNSADYYTSTKAVGKLFRSITLPSLEDAAAQAARAQRKQRMRIRKKEEFKVEDAEADLQREAQRNDDPITRVLRARLSEFLEVLEVDDKKLILGTERAFTRFSSELRHIAATCTLARNGTPLTEEELLVGTIVAKAPQHRRRKELMSKMRDQSTFLVNATRGGISGDDTEPMDVWLRRAWMAWRFSLLQAERDAFGARAFGYIAMGSMFEAIRIIEEGHSDDY